MEGDGYMDNIILIGMPGAGKSTVGVILAKILGYKFLDSDLIIQEKYNCLLKDIIEKEGIDTYIAIENDVCADINSSKTVIATGGSVIYGKEAMKHLRSIGTVVYIKLRYDTIKKRLGDIKQRGVVLREGQNLNDLYKERCPLYEQYAHIVIDCESKNIEEVVETINKQLKKKL